MIYRLRCRFLIMVLWMIVFNYLYFDMTLWLTHKILLLPFCSVAWKSQTIPFGKTYTCAEAFWSFSKCQVTIRVSQVVPSILWYIWESFKEPLLLLLRLRDHAAEQNNGARGCLISVRRKNIELCTTLQTNIKYKNNDLSLFMTETLKSWLGSQRPSQNFRKKRLKNSGEY